MDGYIINVLKVTTSLYVHQKQLENIIEKKNAIHSTNKTSKNARNKPNGQNVILMRTNNKTYKKAKRAPE